MELSPNKRQSATAGSTQTGSEFLRSKGSSPNLISLDLADSSSQNGRQGHKNKAISKNSDSLVLKFSFSTSACQENILGVPLGGEGLSVPSMQGSIQSCWLIRTGRTNHTGPPKCLVSFSCSRRLRIFGLRVVRVVAGR